MGPAARSRAGQAILFLHGGGYVMGSAAAYRGFVSQIVSRTGIAALVIDYPLAPEAALPAAPDAALAAWDYLVRGGFDRIAIVGDSAGGGLSLVTLTQLAEASSRGGAGRRRGLLAMGRPGLLRRLDDRPSHRRSADRLTNICRTARAKYRGAFDASDPLASPLFGDLKGLPPLLIQVGTDERLLDDSRQFAERAAQAGVPVRLEIWEGMHHVFQLDVAHLESSRSALDRAASLPLRGLRGLNISFLHNQGNKHDQPAG